MPPQEGTSEIYVSCDVRLGELVHPVPWLDISLDINPGAINTVLEQLRAEETSTNSPVHFILMHGDNMPDDTLADHEWTADKTSVIRVKANNNGSSKFRIPPDLNRVAIHELQHAVDYQDPTQKYVKQDQRASCIESIRDFGASFIAGLGVTALVASVSIEYLQTIPNLTAGVALAIVSGLETTRRIERSLRASITKRIYKKSPLEIRAREAENLQWHVPSIIGVKYEIKHTKISESA